MRTMKYFLLALVISGAAGSGNAWAQHHHGHTRTYVGIGIGVPVYGSYYPGPYSYPYYPYYPYPYYSYPPVIAVQSAPPVYVERAQEQGDTGQYWYFCNNPQGYYPYVKQCASNWQRVTPFPQGN